MEKFGHLVDREGNVSIYVELDLEKLKKLEDKKLLALQFGEGGAMGEGGSIFLLMKDKVLYHTNYLKGYITLEMLKEQFESIRDLDFGFYPLLHNKNKKFYECIDLGAGNSLFVHKEIISSFNQKLKEKNIKCTYNGTLYGYWPIIIQQILNEGEIIWK